MSYMDALVAHYDMSVVNPPNLAPETVGTLDGTGVGIVASTDLVPGVGGGIATRYNGIDEYTSLPSGVYSPTLPYSISFFIKNYDITQDEERFYGEGNSGNANTIFSIGTGDVGGTGGDKVGIFIRGDAGVLGIKANSTISLSQDGLHHVVWTDEAGDGKLYIDGEPDPTDFSYTPATTTIDRVAIGALVRAAAGDWLDGLVDEVMRFDDVLTEGQIKDLGHRIRTGRL